MTATDYYASVKQHTLQEQGKTQQLRNGVTALKIITFIGMAYTCYLLLTANTATPLWILAALIALFIVLTVWDGRVVRKLEHLKTRIGCCETEMDYIAGKTEHLDRGERYANPVHPYSADLDLFGEESLFQALNRTVFAGADDLLAQQILTPSLSLKEIREKQEAVETLSMKPNQMLEFRVTGILNRLTQEDMETIQKCSQEDTRRFSRKAVAGIYFLNLLSLATWVAVGWGVCPVGYGLCLFLVQLGIVGAYTARTNRIYQKLNHFLKASGKVMRIVETWQNFPDTTERLAKLHEQVLGEANALTAMRSLQRVMNGFDQRNNILAAIVLNGLYMKELHHLIAIGKWCRKYNLRIGPWVEAVQQMDLLVSMGTFRFNHPDYCWPEFGKEVLLHTEEAVHPLLRAERKVGNDLTVRKLQDIYIVTGANMAGKSTFLRTIGINWVLALSGNPVCAKKFIFQPMMLFTSMRTTDNLAKGTSYFHAELLRLKALTEMAEKSGKLFFILDEMLKGTNSKDKLNGSLRFLERLVQLPVAGLVATHDLELGRLEEQYPDHFRNVCFEITHGKEGQIFYDYKLRTGVSRNMNASILLEQMGLIEAATQ